MKVNLKLTAILMLFAALHSGACSNMLGEGDDSKKTKPVLDVLEITTSDSESITLAQPTFTRAGKPVPVVNAYIGVDGTISVSGKDVSGDILEGPVDVSGAGYRFSGLDTSTTYRIIAVAENTAGFSTVDTLKLIRGTTATRVYGQLGSFTTDTYNNGGLSADSLTNSEGLTVDYSGGVYITDVSNNRVLYYANGSTTATRVYGQLGSFTTGTANNGGVSANSLARPCDVAVDEGGVYISDFDNNRVLYYEGESTTATRVYGQFGSFTTNTGNNGGISANSVCLPEGLAIGPGGIYIIELGQNRVLYYEGESTTATRVYGQLGSFTSVGPNKGGAISADGLYNPADVAADSGGVYIADSTNNRVLYYEGESTTATRVYGQLGSFTTATTNKGGLSADSLNRPMGVAVESSGVYIVDNINNRVLYYEGESTTASRVYGQFGSFTTNTQNNGGLSADSLARPYKVTVDSEGVYVTDVGNLRVLWYH